MAETQSSNWIDAFFKALDLPTRRLLMAFAVFWAIALFDGWGYSLDEMGSVVRPLIVILATGFGAAGTVALADHAWTFYRAHQRRKANAVLKIAREKEDAEKSATAIHTTLARMARLNTLEQAILRTALYTNAQTVIWHLNDPNASSLVAKNLLVRLPGVHDEDRWPFYVPDFVFDELVAKRDEWLGSETIRMANGNSLEIKK